MNRRTALLWLVKRGSSPHREAFKLLSLIAFGVVLVAGCASIQPAIDAGTALGVGSGLITQAQADSITRSSAAVGKTFEEITPEQEYYIGRSVAATVLGSYKPYTHEKANRYLNLVGQTLAQASDKPETFGGYHFLILDSDEINAFAAPGGLILVSRGMLRCCKSEDALAAVLAHEIGHVQGQHGLKAIRTDRLTSALTILASEGMKNFGGAELAQLTEAFEGSVGDVASTLMNSGYSRELERQADQAAIAILSRVGYDPHALVDMLTEMEQRLTPGGVDFAKTHPDPRERIAELQGQVGNLSTAAASQNRQVRFERIISAL